MDFSAPAPNVWLSGCVAGLRYITAGKALLKDFSVSGALLRTEMKGMFRANPLQLYKTW